MSSMPASGPGSAGVESGCAMARILQLLNVCFHGFDGSRRRRHDLLCLAAADQCGDPGRYEQDRSDDKAEAHTANTSDRAATAAAMKVAAPKNASRPATLNNPAPIPAC